MNPARFVEVATSGAVVTKYLFISSMRERSTKTRPKASCVLSGLVPVATSGAGTFSSTPL